MTEFNPQDRNTLQNPFLIKKAAFLLLDSQKSEAAVVGKGGYTIDHYTTCLGLCASQADPLVAAAFDLLEHDKHAGGSGVGLFIVKNALQRAGIEYAFEASELGMLFRFRVE